MELYAGFLRYCLNDEFNAKPLQEKFINYLLLFVKNSKNKMNFTNNNNLK